MERDKKMSLAKDLARGIIQFKRIGWQKNTSQEIKKSEFVLLINLLDCITPESKGVKVSELSTIMNITPAAVTHMINSLEKGGFVERLQHPDDRRVVLVNITSKGEEVVKVRHERFLNDLGELVDFLGEDDSKAFIRILYRSLDFAKGTRDDI